MKLPLLTLIICLYGLSTFAQDQGSPHPKTIYYAPNGKKIEVDKVDSVVKAIGGRFMMNKQAFGNDSLVIHLVKLTDAQIKAAMEADAKREADAKEMLGKPALNFTLANLQGDPVTLADLKGKVVVLNFWFTACPPCIAEMPELNSLVKRYDPAKVVFLSLTFDNGQKVKEFLKHEKFTYQHLVDGRKVCTDYNVIGYPTHMVIDKQGILRFSQLGGADIKNTLMDTIDKLLKHS